MKLVWGINIGSTDLFIGSTWVLDGFGVSALLLRGSWDVGCLRCYFGKLALTCSGVCVATSGGNVATSGGLN